jgi:hypothetical protein
MGERGGYGIQLAVVGTTVGDNAVDIVTTDTTVDSASAALVGDVRTAVWLFASLFVEPSPLPPTPDLGRAPEPENVAAGVG